MTPASGKRGFAVPVAAVWLLGAAQAVGAPPVPDLVPARSGARFQAVAALSAASSVQAPCLTPLVQSVRSDRQRGTAATRRSLAILANDPTLPGERVAFEV